MRVGIIAEGPTDQRVIEAIVKGVVNGDRDAATVELQVHYVQPEQDASGAAGHGGWGLVFEALRRKQHVDALQLNDLLVIQLDTDVSELAGFDVPRRAEGRELTDLELVDQVIRRLQREIDPTFLSDHGDRILFAIAVNELECWLLPLVYENRKARKTVGCFEALTQGLKDRNELGLLRRDGQAKDPARYARVAAPLRKSKELRNACESSPSLARFVDELGSRVAALRLGPPYVGG